MARAAVRVPVKCGDGNRGARAAAAASNRAEAMMNLVAEILNYKIEDAEGEWNGTKNVMIRSEERDVFCNYNSFETFLRCSGFICCAV